MKTLFDRLSAAIISVTPAQAGVQLRYLHCSALCRLEPSIQWALGSEADGGKVAGFAASPVTGGQS
jgi:hypothetical protein